MRGIEKRSIGIHPLKQEANDVFLKPWMAAGAKSAGNVIQGKLMLKTEDKKLWLMKIKSVSAVRRC